MNTNVTSNPFDQFIPHHNQPLTSLRAPSPDSSVQFAQPPWFSQLPEDLLDLTDRPPVQPPPGFHPNPSNHTSDHPNKQNFNPSVSSSHSHSSNPPLIHTTSSTGSSSVYVPPSTPSVITSQFTQQLTNIRNQIQRDHQQTMEERFEQRLNTTVNALTQSFTRAIQETLLPALHKPTPHPTSVPGTIYSSGSSSNNTFMQQEGSVSSH